MTKARELSAAKGQPLTPSTTVPCGGCRRHQAAGASRAECLVQSGRAPPGRGNFQDNCRDVCEVARLPSTPFCAKGKKLYTQILTATHRSCRPAQICIIPPPPTRAAMGLRTDSCCVSRTKPGGSLVRDTRRIPHGVQTSPLCVLEHAKSSTRCRQAASAPQTHTPGIWNTQNIQHDMGRVG